MQIKSLVRLLKPGERVRITGDHIELAEQFEELMAMGLVEFNNVDYNRQGAVAWVKSMNIQKVYRFLNDTFKPNNLSLPKSKRMKTEEDFKVIIRKGKGKIEAPSNWKPVLPATADSRPRFRSIVRAAFDKYIYRIYKEEYFIGQYQVSYDDLTQMILVNRVNVEQTLPQTTIKKVARGRTGSARNRSKSH